MFGALGFGQLAFGQSVTGAGLSTETTFGFATSATLGSGLPIAADAALAVTVAAVLSAGTPLAVETGFAIGTSADIPGATQVIFLVNGSGGARVRFPSLTIHDVLARNRIRPPSSLKRPKCRSDRPSRSAIGH